MGISILNLASDIYRKHVRSMIDLAIDKKKLTKYTDTSTIPTILSLFAISEAAKADISITGAAFDVFSGHLSGSIIEGSRIHYTMGDLHGFDTNKVADDPSYVDLIKSDKFISTYVASYEYTQDQGQAFIMKGVDTITGQVNGFVNIVPDLGSVAVGFTGEFSTLAGSGTTVASFGSLVEVSNSSENTTLITGAELLATTYNTNLVPTTNLIEWPAEESDSAFEYMDSATFATFDTFVGAKSKSGTYKLDGVVSNIADFAIFTPAYKYGFLDV